MSKKYFFLFPLTVLLIIQLACGSSTPTVSTATSPSEISVDEPSPTEEIKKEPTANPTNTPTASPTNTPTTRPTPTAELGTRRDNPAPVGSTVTVDDMELAVISILRPADSIVKAGNMFNTEPEPGNEYIFVNVSVKCVKQSTETCSISTFNFKMVGSLGIKYDAEWFLTGVKGLLEDTDFYGGTQLTGDLAFIVGIDEQDLLLMYEPYWEDPFYLAIE